MYYITMENSEHFVFSKVVQFSYAMNDSEQLSYRVDDSMRLIMTTEIKQTLTLLIVFPNLLIPIIML